MLELHGLALPALGAVAALGEPAVVVVAVIFALEARDDRDPARGARSTTPAYELLCLGADLNWAGYD